jgi:hypothetical protein
LYDVDSIIIGGGVVARPLPTMTDIIEKQGSEWDNIDEMTFLIGMRAISVRT